MNFIKKDNRFLTLSLGVAMLCCVIVIGGIITYEVNASGVSNSNQLGIRTYVPNQIPLRITQVSTNLRPGEGVDIDFDIINTSGKDLGKVSFIVLVVGPNGDVKSGIGQEIRTNVKNLTSTNAKLTVNRSLEPNDTLVLSTYQASGDSGSFNLNPVKLLNMLGQEGLVRQNTNFSKTVGEGLLQVSPCQAGQNFATASCSCGVKTFSCNPETGQYSFECFPPPSGQSQCESGGDT